MRGLIPWLGAPPLGLLIGLAAWLLVSGSSVQGEKLAALGKDPETPAWIGAVREEQYARELTNRPLFALSSARGTAREPTLQIIGVSITRKRQAALIAIDGEPAAWMAPGERHDGVVLLEIDGTQVLIETPLGPKAMQVGERSGEGPTPLAGGQSVVDQMPPGFRGPPPPADAPGG